MLEACGALQLLDGRMQRTGRVVRRALVEHARMGLVRHARPQLSYDPRLADPGFAREQHDLTLAALRLPPAAQ
jgi:hypothetical protein